MLPGLSESLSQAKYRELPPNPKNYTNFLPDLAIFELPVSKQISIAEMGV